MFVPYGYTETSRVRINYFMKCSTMPNPAYKDKRHFSLPGFYIGFHGTTSENRALHVKLADSDLSLDELKQIWSESPAEIGVRWITEYDDETFELPSDFADWYATIVAKHHLKFYIQDAEKAAYAPLKSPVLVTLTFNELECDLEEFKEELKSESEESDSESESEQEELQGAKRSSSMADLPAPKRVKSEL